MSRSSPQSFEKRQRERRKQQKREEKLERRLIRNEEKRRAKEGLDPLQAQYPHEAGTPRDEPPPPER